MPCPPVMAQCVPDPSPGDMVLGLVLVLVPDTPDWVQNQVTLLDQHILGLGPLCIDKTG